MKTLTSIAKELAQELDGWDYDADASTARHPTLSTCTGANIWFNTERYHDGTVKDSDRLVFHVGWPTPIGGYDFRPHDEKHTITCSAKRTVTSIANDIKRRLLPKYLPRYKEMVEQKRQVAERNRRTEQNAERLANALGVDYKKGTHAVRAYGDTWGTFEVSDADVRIDLRRVPIEMALGIARLLRG